jgi:hypothetical protein
MFYLIVGKGKRGEVVLEQAVLDTQVGTATLRMLEHPKVKAVEVQALSQRAYLRHRRHPAPPPDTKEEEEEEEEDSTV